MSLYGEILKAAARVAIVRETVSDEESGKRLDICRRCDKNDGENCKVCGCFIELKVKTKTNYNPKKMRTEITHCPLGKWHDKETANKYREIDGLVPI